MREISAGGVVYRKNELKLEMMMIEDRYARWSLPKGKIEQGETIEQTAIREIEEETGIIGKIVDPIEVIFYNYYHPKYGQIKKEVHYYLVEAIKGELEAQVSEINCVKWCDPHEAWKLQSSQGYENNHTVVRKALNQLGIEV
jgi:8-oxo-dGTP pyrophosphatase MutT (NUDIX family)